jgi:hypothetical protein
MKQWEYKIFKSAPMTSDDLNVYGRHGWELTSVIDSGIWTEYIFKREKE